MDIAAASSLSQLQLASQISVAVALKSRDAEKQQGEAAIQLLEAAAQTAAPVPSPDGLGAAVDVRG